MTTKPKCGNCAFSYIVPQDLKIRVCKGGPPQGVVMPGQGLQFIHPIVNVENDPCAHHKFKSLLDMPEGSA